MKSKLPAYLVASAVIATAFSSCTSLTPSYEPRPSVNETKMYSLEPKRTIDLEKTADLFNNIYQFAR